MSADRLAACQVRSNSSFGRWHIKRALMSLTLVCSVSVLLLLVDASGAMPQPLQRLMPIRAATVHAQTLEPAPVISLISPSSGSGPVEAHVTISGSNFTGSTATIFAQTSADCVSGQQQVLGSPPLTGGGFSNFTFVWPASLASGTYYICTSPAPASPPTYQVLSSSPPVLSLSTPVVQAGQTVTISGSHFVGASSVSLNLLLNGQQVGSIGTASPGGDGSFAVQYTADGSVTGNVTISGTSAPDGGAPPALQASVSLVIEDAPTATPSPSPSPSPTAPATVTSTVTSAIAQPPQSDQNSGGGGLLALIVVGFILALVVVLGIVVFFVLRGRGAAPGGYPGGPSGPTGPGGFGKPVGGMGQFGAFGPSSGERLGSSSPFARSGMFDRPDPYAEPQIGAVAQWGEAPETWGADESTPGADWQPRPMSGGHRPLEDPGFQPYPAPSNPPSGLVPPLPGLVPPPPGLSGVNPPPDPWGDARGAFGPTASDAPAPFGGPPAAHASGSVNSGWAPMPDEGTGGASNADWASGRGGQTRPAAPDPWNGEGQ